MRRLQYFPVGAPQMHDVASIWVVKGFVCLLLTWQAAILVSKAEISGLRVALAGKTQFDIELHLLLSILPKPLPNKQRACPRI